MGGLKQEMIALETANKTRRLEDTVTKNEIANDNQLALSELAIVHAESDQRVQETETQEARSTMYTRLDAVQRIMDANIDAATTRQQTNIVTELTHAISTGD